MSGGLMSLIAYGHMMNLPNSMREFFEDFDNQHEFIIYQMNCTDLAEYDEATLLNKFNKCWFYKVYNHCWFVNDFETRDLSNYKPYTDYVNYGIMPTKIIDFPENDYDKVFYNQQNSQFISNNIIEFLTEKNMCIIMRQLLNNQKFFNEKIRGLFNKFATNYHTFENNNSIMHNLTQFMKTQTIFSHSKLHETFMQFSYYCYYCNKKDNEIVTQLLGQIHDELNMNWNGNEGVVEKVFVDDYLMKHAIKYFL